MRHLLMQSPERACAGRVWKPIFSDVRAAEAIQAARDVAARLVSPDEVERAAREAARQTLYPRSTHWIPFATSQGYAGLAMLWSYLDACFGDEGWDVVGKQHLQLAVRGVEAQQVTEPGTFSGLSGVAFAAHLLSREGSRYRTLLTALDQEISTRASDLAVALEGKHEGVTVGDFDIISGLSGVGAYLLLRCEHARPAAALKQVTNALVRLVLVREGDVPRWHVPARLLWDKGMIETYPHGNLNCGLAHGIPGVLAFLALAKQQGIDVDNLGDALHEAANWISSNRYDDEWGVNWPNAVPLVQESPSNGLRPGNSHSAPDGPGRCAWCYGSPGIARALWLAGQAVNNDDYCQLAIEALAAVYRKPISERRIDASTFCHGVAGLLQITLRFAHDTGLSLFIEQSDQLANQILQNYDQQSLLGFRNLETAGNEIDQAGLLDGASGVALVLLAGATGVDPVWDRLFLLS